MRDHHLGPAGLTLENGGNTATVGPAQVDALAVTHAAQFETRFRKPALANEWIAPCRPDFHEWSGNRLGPIDGVAAALLMPLAQAALHRVARRNGPAPPLGQPVLVLQPFGDIGTVHHA